MVLLAENEIEVLIGHYYKPETIRRLEEPIDSNLPFNPTVNGSLLT